MNRLLPPLFPDEPEQSSKSLWARLIDWTIRPFNLGVNTSFAAGTCVILISCLSHFEWDRVLILRFLMGPLSSYFAAALGVAVAKDGNVPYPDGVRPWVALIGGIVAGGFVGMTLGDWWIASAASLGGGIGSLMDAVIYPDALEDDW